MKKWIILVMPLCLSINAVGQVRAFNQNSARSNHYKSSIHNVLDKSLSDAWDFGINQTVSIADKSNESSMFRTNSMATKMFVNYYMGNIGLGLSSGFITGSIDNTELDNFIIDRKYKLDQVQVNQIKPFNSYFLFGPTIRFGNRVVIKGALQGGLFMNSSGGVTLGVPDATGVVRSVYRFDSGSKNIFPGFSGNISISYPINNSTSFSITSEFLQTKTSVRLYDPQGGVDSPKEMNRDVKLYGIGIGICKTFSSKNNAISQRLLPTVNKREIAIDEPGVQLSEVVSPRDIATGQASGKRLLPTVNKREIAIDEPGVHLNDIKAPRDVATGQASGKSNAQFNPKEYTLGKTYQPGQPVYGNKTTENCGPVTIKETHPDGTVEEKTFECPDDAANYAKQTQNNSFGEKEQSGLQQAGSAKPNGMSYLKKEGIVHRDLASRNVLVGRISLNSGSQSGIVTNQSAAVSSVSSLAGSGGASTAAYAATGRMASSGAPSAAIFVRETASGKASGRTEMVYSDEQGLNMKSNGNMSSLSTNPLYQDKENKGINPLYENSSRMIPGRDNDCDGISGIRVDLVDASSNLPVATTHTESCGEFYFANVPTGDYVVKITGQYLSKKGYDFYMTKKSNVVGKMVSPDTYWNVDLTTAIGTVEDAQALVKSKTKSNQSNDRMSGADSGSNQQKSIINTSRSNIKNLAVAIGDVDGDGTSDMIVGSVASNFGEKVNQGLHAAGGALASGASFVGGSLPGGAVISAMCSPGNPIGGLTIKGGKNPGGNARTTQTNENGEFEFPNWSEGNYTISTELNYYLDDETVLSLGDDEVSENSGISESKLKNGAVKVTATQNSQSLKSNINSINGGMPNRISMNVTVPKQTQGATFGDKTQSNPNDLNAPTAKWRNNNTVRSNRTDNAIIMADLDGDGEMDSSFMNFNGEIATINITEPGVHYSDNTNATGGINITEPGVRKTIEKGVGPVKWMAPEVLSKRVWGDPHINENEGTLKLGSGSYDLVNQGKWKCQDVAIKAVRCADGACVILTGKGEDFPAESKVSLNGLPPGQPVKNAQFVFVSESGKTFKTQTDSNGKLSLNGLPPGISLQMVANFGVEGNDDILITFSTDAQGNTISNVLKTKHDTVKNSINNIR